MDASASPVHSLPPSAPLRATRHGEDPRRARTCSEPFRHGRTVRTAPPSAALIARLVERSAWSVSDMGSAAGKRKVETRAGPGRACVHRRHAALGEHLEPRLEPEKRPEAVSMASGAIGMRAPEALEIGVVEETAIARLL